jgi:hypothetical protein
MMLARATSQVRVDGRQRGVKGTEYHPDDGDWSPRHGSRASVWMSHSAAHMSECRTRCIWLSTAGHKYAPLMLNASKMIMRPERVTEEHLAPSLEQTDCRYDEGSLQESEKVA